MLDRAGVGTPALRIAAMGWFVVAAVTAGAALVVFGFREPAGAQAAVPARLGRSLGLLVRDAAVRRVIASDLCVSLGQGFRTSMFIFFVSAYLGLAQWASLLLFTQYAFGLLAPPIWLRISYRFGKHRTVVMAELFQAAVNAAMLALAPGQAVCDIGCGYGATAAELAATGVTVTGLTLSAAQAQVAHGRGAPGVAVMVRDWLDNGLRDASFDRAYSIESSEHMVDKPRFFAEAFRVLRPGGRLVVCAWLEGDGVGPWEVRHLLKPICSEGRLPSMGSRADYEALAAAAGFRLAGYDDISRNVRRTWSICLRRLLGKVVTDPGLRRLAMSSATRSRDFILSLPRLILALRTGAMRYGVFVWDKA